MKPRDVWPLVKEAVKSWVDDRAPSMGAALSYYTVFSTAPLLLIVIGVVGLVLGGTAAQDAVVAQLQALLGEQAAAVVNEMLEHVQRPGQGIAATVVGAGALVVGATTVFAELQDDLDRIFESPARAAPVGLWGWLRVRILSLGMVLTAGFLLLVSLLVSTALAAVGGWIGNGMEGWQLLAKGLNFALSFGLITAMFAMLYRYLPQSRTAWRDVWFGAAITALLFNLGKFLIGMYLGRSSVTEGFGATGSLAVFLLWVYYSAQIFLLGAEFTWVCARRRGAAAVPVANSAAADGGGNTVVQPAARSPALVDRPMDQPVAQPRDLPVDEPAPAPGRVFKQLGIGAAVGAAAGAALWFIAARRRARQGWLQPAFNPPSSRS